MGEAGMAAVPGAESVLRGSDESSGRADRHHRSQERPVGHYVYRYDLDGVPIYVGKGSGKRAWVHLIRAQADHGYKTSIQIEMTEQIRSGRTISVAIVQDGLSEADALALEVAIIEQIGRRSRGGTLWNTMRGGEVPPSVRGMKFENRRELSQKGLPGKRWSEQDRVRHSHRMKEYMSDPEVRRKVSEAKRGRPGPKHTAESRAKISAAQRGPSLAKSVSKTGALNPMFGRKWFHQGDRRSLFFPDAVPEGWLPGKK